MSLLGPSDPFVEQQADRNHSSQENLRPVQQSLCVEGEHVRNKPVVHDVLNFEDKVNGQSRGRHLGEFRENGDLDLALKGAGTQERFNGDHRRAHGHGGQEEQVRKVVRVPERVDLLGDDQEERAKG